MTLPTMLPARPGPALDVDSGRTRGPPESPVAFTGPAAPSGRSCRWRWSAGLAAYADHPDRDAALGQLASETWLLARARALHARWRARLSLPVDTEHLKRWDLVVEQAYLAHRRVARGRTEPPGVLDRLAAALAADATAFATPAPQAAADPALRAAVAAIAASVLDAPPQRLFDGAEFTAFPAFSSFRLVELIERVERDLEVELDADELIPENLRRVDDLCQIALRPRAAAPAA